ncbi:MFS transporter [Mucilaginibacter sp.]|uniref:MFS transporter n=1 Tax=Mucilaginibacter sp. TaxID=1882438 RepID=UPI003AFFDFBC
MLATQAVPVTNTTPKLLSKAWLTVGLLCVVGCLNYLDRTMITTMRESVVKAIPMTNAQFGLLTSVFLWVYGFLSPAAGFLADRFNRSRVIISSLLVWSIITLATSYVKTYEQLLITRALMGISEACYIPAALALIVDYHKGSTRSLATGIHIAGITLGSSLGFLGGWIAENHNWTTAFGLFGIIGVSYSVILLFTLRDAPKAELNIENYPIKTASVQFGAALKNIFSSRSYILTLIYFGLLGIVGWMILGWLPTYYKEHFKVTQAAAGLYATGYIYPASLVGVITGGFLADKWHKSNKKARILLPVIGLVIAAPFIFMASYTNVLLVAIICFMVFVFMRSFTDANLMPVLCLIIDTRYLATAYGILNLCACVIGGLGIYAAGLLRDSQINLSVAFQFAALIMLISAVLLYNVKPKPAVFASPAEL